MYMLLLGIGWFIFLYDERKRYNYYYATVPQCGFPNCRQDGTVAVERISACGFNCSDNQKDNDIYAIHTYMDNDSFLLRICQHTCRLVAAVFRSGHPVHVKYLLYERRAGVSCELCSCDLSV